MHTVKIICVGLVVLAVCLIGGRLTGSRQGVAIACLVFVALWFLGAGLNLYIGVTRAGYSIRDELPVFLIVFAVPAMAALAFLWWRR